MEKRQVKFSVKNEIRSDDVSTIEHAMKSVDADAKVNVDIDAHTVSVDSCRKSFLSLSTTRTWT
jgi:copper chaperone CopZ